jgi:glycine/D-amino acid oxidase-like deaminating enzyme
MTYDYIVAGGGLIGAAVANGLARKGKKIAVLDEGDRAFRASRGNFGLVWVQGKGAKNPAYAKWSGYAADLWSDFDQELREQTGINTGYARSGGMELAMSEQDWDAQSEDMAAVHKNTDGKFEYEMLDHAELKKRLPKIGKEVVGASYSPQDGHVNPLYLLRSLHQNMQVNSCDYFANRRIEKIEKRDAARF